MSVTNDDAKPWAVFGQGSMVYTTVILLPMMVLQIWWACVRLPLENYPDSVYLWRLGGLPLVFVFSFDSVTRVFGLALTGLCVQSKRNRVLFGALGTSFGFAACLTSNDGVVLSHFSAITVACAGFFLVAFPLHVWLVNGNARRYQTDVKINT